jgi:ATP-dependent DNA helicase RecG
LIEESDKETLSQVKSALTEFVKIKKRFPNLKVDLLHGKQKPAEKEVVIEKFRQGKIDILVSTPVVEVGVDIPNATIMIIETADRFGLAALHQLRGRVGRGKKKSYCLLFTESKSKKATARLKALKKTLSGFELAELDLQTRGPGEVFGRAQSGFPELKIAHWSDLKLIKEAKSLADEIVSEPQKFKKTTNFFKSRQIASN